MHFLTWLCNAETNCFCDRFYTNLFSLKKICRVDDSKYEDEQNFEQNDKASLMTGHNYNIGVLFTDLLREKMSDCDSQSTRLLFLERISKESGKELKQLEEFTRNDIKRATKNIQEQMASLIQSMRINAHLSNISLKLFCDSANELCNRHNDGKQESKKIERIC